METLNTDTTTAASASAQLTAEQTMTVYQITQKLLSLRVEAKYEKIQTGPVVSTYFFTLSNSTPIAKILGASEDLALAVGAPSVLIYRVSNLIAIDIPNRERQLISFDSCLHKIFQQNHTLPIMLGVDTQGVESYIDLIQSPHILIAGSTGAGKSIYLSSLIAGLACARSKQEMKLILVDTKKLDLPLFENLPHVVDVADDLDKVRDLLDRLLLIVHQRTQKLKSIARNLQEYNLLASTPLPYYVVIIDELADIIMQDRSRGKGVRHYEKAEHKLQNLLQICRAVGIHIICATQRPSVEIITGDIKANLPTRIALRLPSIHDSKTILNQTGAESLLRRGDMLIESLLFNQVTRFHGPFVSMTDIANVIINCDEIRRSYGGVEAGLRAGEGLMGGK